LFEKPLLICYNNKDQFGDRIFLRTPF